MRRNGLENSKELIKGTSCNIIDKMNMNLGQKLKPFEQYRGIFYFYLKPCFYNSFTSNVNLYDK